MLNFNYRMDFICCWTILLQLHWMFAGVKKVSFLRGQWSLHWQLSVWPFIFWQQSSCSVTLEKPQKKIYFMLNSNYRMDFICCWTILLRLHWKIAGVEKVSFLRGQRSLHWQLSVRPFIFWQQSSCFVTLEKPQRRLPTGDWDGQKSIFDTSGKGRDFWDPMSIRLLRTWNM